jgi:hypothetical protein
MTGPRVLFAVKEGPETKCAGCETVIPPRSYVSRGLPGDAWAVMCRTCRPFEIIDQDEALGAAQTAQQVEELWGLVELMGHQKIAGRLSEVTMYGAAWLRVDVPDRAGQPGFSQLYGSGAVYRITFATKDVALQAVEQIQAKPPIRLWGAEQIPEWSVELEAEMYMPEEPMPE